MSSSNIANTPIKAFEVLRKLSAKDCPLEELLDGFTDDTLRLYINSMKLCGIKISSPSKGKKEYSLVENLDFINLSFQDYKNLLSVKKIIAQRNDYKQVIDFNNFILSFSKYTNASGKEKLLKIMDAPPVSLKLHSRIFEIEKAILSSKLLLVEYSSPNSATNYFKILPKYLKIQNSKIYVYGIDASIREMRYLPLLRVKSLKVIDEKIEDFNISSCALCRFNSQKNDIKKFENFEIVKKNAQITIAKVYYENSFEFIQKVLSCAEDCIVLEPSDIREKIAGMIKEVGELYAK